MIFNPQKGLRERKDTNGLENIGLPNSIGSNEEMEIFPCKIEEESGVRTELFEMQ